MRLNDLQGHLEQEGLDGCILSSDDPNFRYYLQKDVQHGLLFIPHDTLPTVFIHDLEELDHEFGVVKLRDDALATYLNEYEKVGYNKTNTTIQQFETWNEHVGLFDISDALSELRTVKTGREIDYLRQAAKYTDAVLRDTLRDFRYDTEGAVRNDLRAAIAQRGLEESFTPIVAFHESAATPHYHGDKPLGDGFLLIDVGVSYNGYCADITRTVHVGDGPTERERNVYERVKTAQQACMEMVAPGVSCRDVFERAEDELNTSLMHGLGHGLGVEVHERPNIKEGTDDTLQEGMVVTIEPGWYDDFGVRIEDDILVTDNGYERLTTTPRSMHVDEY